MACGFIRPHATSPSSPRDDGLFSRLNRSPRAIAVVGGGLAFRSCLKPKRGKKLLELDGGWDGASYGKSGGAYGGAHQRRNIV